MGIVKGFLIIVLLACGTVSLLVGFGAEIPYVKYKEIEAYGVPAGVLLLAAGIALARFWKIEEHRKTTIFDANGVIRKINETVIKKIHD